MKKLLFAFVLIVFSAASASAWTMRMHVGGIRYECRQLGSDLECRSGGKVVGWVKKRGSETIYTDDRNRQVGSVSTVGGRWQYKGQNGAISGSAQREGNNIVYKDGSGRVLGYAKREGAKTAYTNAGNTDIGSADTDSMPLRPLPLEEWLRKNK